MIEALKTYLESGLGGLADCHSVKVSRSFPLVISSGYNFYRAKVMGRECVLALAIDGRAYTPRMVQRQLSRVGDEFSLPIVFVARQLHPHDKERYLAIGQSLIVPGKFAYLPFAGMKQDDTRKDFVLTRESLSPLAQLIVLAFLEKRLQAPVTIKGVIDLLEVTPPAVQNAFKEIESFGLADRRRRLGEKNLELLFRKEGRGLWNQAQAVLISPVKRTVGLLAAPKIDNDCVLAGVDALSEISQLNAQQSTEFACSLKGFANRGLQIVSTIGAPFKMQLWSYAPNRLGGNSVDVLSLILSLRGETDDRVQIEIERILEEFKW